MRSTSCCSRAASIRKGLMAAPWYRWHALCEERAHELAEKFLHTGPAGCIGARRRAALCERCHGRHRTPAGRRILSLLRARWGSGARGRDARRRKQYRYHPRWQEVRDESKYGRLVAFGRALPRMRRRVTRDLARPGLPQEKALATIVRLLETTFIRVGNEEYARENESFGLTTLRERQGRLAGAPPLFRFRGQSGGPPRGAPPPPRPPAT